MYWKLLDKCFGIFLPHPSSSPPHPTSTDQRTAWFGPAAASFVVSEFNSNKKHKERNPGMTHIWLLSCDLNLAYVVVISAPVTLVLLRCAQEGKDKQVETLCRQHCRSQATDVRYNRLLHDVGEWREGCSFGSSNNHRYM